MHQGDPSGISHAVNSFYFSLVQGTKLGILILFGRYASVGRLDNILTQEVHEETGSGGRREYVGQLFPTPSERL